MAFENPHIEYAQLWPLFVVFGVACVGVLVEAFVPRGVRYVTQVGLTVVGLLAVVIALCLRFSTGRPHVWASIVVAFLTAVSWCCLVAFSPGGMDARIPQIAAGGGAAPLLPSALAAAASLVAVAGIPWRIVGAAGLVGLLAGPGIPAVQAVAASAAAQEARRSEAEELVQSRIEEAVVPFVPSDGSVTSFYVDETQSRYVRSIDGEDVVILTRPVGALSPQEAACRPSQPDLAVTSCVQQGALWLARDDFSTSVTVIRSGRTVSAVLPNTTETTERGARLLTDLREATPAEVEAAVRHRIEVESPVDANHP